MSWKKKLTTTALVVGLSFSTAGLPANTYLTPISYAAETTSVDQLAERLTNLYSLLSPEEKAQVTQVTTELQNVTNAEWNEILGAALVAKVDGILGPGKTIAIAKDTAAIILSTNPTALKQDIENYRDRYASDFDKVFGADLTVDTMLDFFVALETKLTDQNFIISQISAPSLDVVVEEAVQQVLGQDAFTGLDGKLSAKLGVNIAGFLEIKNRLQDKIDPNNQSIGAVIKGLARSKGAHTVYANQTLTVGQSLDLDFEINVDPDKPIKIGSLVEFVSNNSDVAEIQGLKLVAKSSGTTTVQAKIMGNVVLDEDTFTVTGSSTGGGGGTPGGGGGGTVTPPPASVQVPVTETPGTNDQGQTTVTVTINEQEALQRATGSTDPVNLTLTVKTDGDVITAPLSGKTIQELAKDNANNLVTLSTPAGSVTFTAGQLAEALKFAAAQGLSTDNLKVGIVVEKKGDADKSALAGSIGGGAEVLTTPIQLRLTLTGGDKTVEVTDFQSYVSASVNVTGDLNPANLVGVEYKTGAATTFTKEVTTAATSLRYTPIPTVIEKKDGKTAVKVYKRTNNPFAVVKNTKSFTDIAGQWFTGDVELLANKLLVQGRTATTFVPQGTLTRAEFATLLVRALGLPEDAAAANQFTDVSGKDWFAGYVGAAWKAGLINGYPDKSFKAGAPVKREEAAKMIVKAMELAGTKLTVTAEEQAALLAKFKDAGQLSDWAKAYMAALVKAEVFKGDTQGKVNPKATSTRAESAALLKRLLTNLKFISE